MPKNAAVRGWRFLDIAPIPANHLPSFCPDPTFLLRRGHKRLISHCDALCPRSVPQMSFAAQGVLNPASIGMSPHSIIAKEDCVGGGARNSPSRYSPSLDIFSSPQYFLSAFAEDHGLARG
jgi:hypothetical protein